MPQEQDLFGKTFDQQLEATGGNLTGHDIAPNRRIAGEIVLEPTESGIRVTARDAEHCVLWGYVGSKETTQQIHCWVATYDTLQNLVAEELEKRSLIARESQDPVGAAHRALEAVEKTIKWLRRGLEVKDVTRATLERARTIARIVSDADRQMTHEASTLKGLKSKTDKTA